MSPAQSLKRCNDSSTTSRASSSEDGNAGVLQFPVSLPAASALLNILIIAITRHYNAEVDGISKGTLGVVALCRQLVRPENTTKQVPWQVYVFKAMDAVKDVILDVTDVLQICDDDLERCRAWMSQAECEWSYCTIVFLACITLINLVVCNP
ncbi:hypothetical protein BD769DRAFT_1778621 [Suillus cothurnatus]|nr:hypothetical protein BD769DRAFT_1778621 [Suillus cothurnatus]